MDLDIKKDILHKSCEIKISDLKKQLEEMYKDNKDMFKKYKDSLTKYHISNEISKKLKIDLVNIENKYKFIESQLNNLIIEKEEWTAKDEDMTAFLHENNFRKPEELREFINKHRNHKCLCNCKPVKELTKEDLIDNPVYKEYLMFMDIFKFNEKENDKLRWENIDQYNKILLLEKGSKDNINVKETDEYIKLLNEFNSLKTKQKDIEEDYIKIQNNENNIDVESNDKFIKLKEDYNNLIEKENKQDNKDEKDDIIDELKNTIEELNEKLNNKDKEIPLITPSSSTKKKEKCSQVVNKNKYSKNVNIFIYDNANNKWQEHIANDTVRDIDNIIELKRLIDTENSTLNKVEKWTKENTKNSCRTKKFYIKKNIERSIEIYNIHKDKLKYVNFSLNNLSRLSEKEYKLWKEDLNDVINKLIKKKCSQVVNKLENKKIINFDNKKFKEFMLLSFIYKNKVSIKDKLNKENEIKLEYYKNIDLTKLKKGEMFEFLNSHGTKQRRSFRGLCIYCKIIEVEDRNNSKCNACISCEGLGVPAAMVYRNKKTYKNTIKNNKCNFINFEGNNICKSFVLEGHNKCKYHLQFCDICKHNIKEKCKCMKKCKNVYCNKQIPMKYDFCRKHN